MGDRTNVTITVRKEDFDRLVAERFSKEADGRKAFANEVGASFIEEQALPGEERFWMTIEAEEVNYADWEDLQNILRENKIPYDKSWGAGGEYSRGESYVRLVDGKMQELEFYDEDSKLVDFLKEVKGLPADEIKEKVMEEYQKQFPWEIEKL